MIVTGKRGSLYIKPEFVDIFIRGLKDGGCDGIYCGDCPFEGRKNGTGRCYVTVISGELLSIDIIFSKLTVSTISPHKLGRFYA